jgi:hypothetical protein
MRPKLATCGSHSLRFTLSKITTTPVIPAKAGIHSSWTYWTPACAAVTAIFICLGG